MHRYPLLIVFVFCVCGFGFSQSLINRSYTGTWLNIFDSCKFQRVTPTIDGGYLLSYAPYSLVGSPNVQALGITIKTDVNLLPQWTIDAACISLSLPTGGIILIWRTLVASSSSPFTTYIEKRTLAGAVVWSKSLTASHSINDLVRVGGNLRLVGGYYGGLPFTMEIDTLGNLISQGYLASPMMQGMGEITSVKLLPSGDYLCTGSSNLILAKFNASFINVWAAFSANSFDVRGRNAVELTDGSFVLSGESRGVWTNTMQPAATLLKFSSAGNLIKHKRINGVIDLSAICQSNTNALVMSCRRSVNDSLFLISSDDTLGLSALNFAGRGAGIGSPFNGNSGILTTTYAGNLKIKGFNNNLSACVASSVASRYSSASLSTFTTNSLFWFGPTATLTPSSSLPLQSIYSLDTCDCMPQPLITPNICFGVPTSIQLNTYGTVNWYNSATGGTLISNTATFTPLNPAVGIYTVYTQHSCWSSGSIPVIYTVNPMPVLLAAAIPSVICAGQSSSLIASGATTYSWSHGVQGASVSSASLLSNSVFSLNAYSSSGCSLSTSIGVSVNPLPLLTLYSTPAIVCVNFASQLIAGGATSYTWSTGSTSSSITTGAVTQNTVFSVAGSSSLGCVAIQQLTISPFIPGPLNVYVCDKGLCYGSPQIVCADGALSFLWNNIPGSPTHNSAPIFTPQTLYVTGVSNGCIETKSIQLTPNPEKPISIAASATIICAGEKIQFSASGANTYVWSFGGTGVTQNYSAGTSTIITVQGYDSNNCMATNSLSIVVEGCLGIKSPATFRDVKIFPVPTSKLLTIEFPSVSLHRIRILMTDGTLVAESEQAGTVQFNCESLPNGLYLLEIDGIKGKFFVKE